jgi:predicted alpha/beta hydrolase family esterase
MTTRTKEVAGDVARLCIVPRWSGTAQSDFYPWLLAQPAVRARFGEILLPEIAQPGEPTIAAWVESLQQVTAGPGGPGQPGDLGRTYFLGHSVGCQAVLRFLERSSGNTPAAGVLCVAGWWNVDRPWDSIRPWIQTAMDVARVRATARRFHVLLSDNDPFTADWRENERAWRERLGAEVRCVPGAKHFNAAEEPAVLDALLALAGAAA